MIDSLARSNTYADRRMETGSVPERLFGADVIAASMTSSAAASAAPSTDEAKWANGRINEIG